MCKLLTKYHRFIDGYARENAVIDTFGRLVREAAIPRLQKSLLRLCLRNYER